MLIRVFTPLTRNLRYPLVSLFEFLDNGVHGPSRWLEFAGTFQLFEPPQVRSAVRAELDVLRGLGIEGLRLHDVIEEHAELNMRHYFLFFVARS